MASCHRVATPLHLNLMLCCMLLLAAITVKGVCAKTVLHNNSGRDLVLIMPQQQKLGHNSRIDIPAGQSVELQGAQQQRGVMIQDVESGAAAGPVDLPDNHSIMALPLGHSSTSTSATSNPLAASKAAPNLATVDAHIPNLVDAGLLVG